MSVHLPEVVKKHPILIVGGLVGAIGVYLLLSSGSSSSASSGGTNAADASIYAAQANASTQQQAIGASLQAAQETNATNLQALTIQSQTQLGLNDQNSQIALAQISATQETTDLANTLTANVATSQIKGQTDVAAIQGNVAINQFTNLANVLIAQSNDNASVATAAIGSQCHGFSCLF
jgi:hypothetical protein